MFSQTLKDKLDMMDVLRQVGRIYQDIVRTSLKILFIKPWKTAWALDSPNGITREEWMVRIRKD